MTSFQSTLGDEEGIAEELAQSQREISIAEFFEKNKHMLGFDSGARGLVTAVKEAVDNALDATEEAGIHPYITVEIHESGDYYELIIEDNGPGITKEQLPKIFGKLLYGSRFHARKQSRGQQGIGISAAVLYSQLTSGKPAKITSRTVGSDTAQYFELIIDTDTNEPEIKTETELSPRDSDLSDTHGTRIHLEMEANMRARTQLHDYMKHTAVVNPHARLVLYEPGLEEAIEFERVEGASLPAETEEIRPHPHGVELGTLIKMLGATESYSISGFLQEEFTRVGKKTAAKVIDNFRDRYFGREMSWAAPTAADVARRNGEGVTIEDAITEAVSGKGADATEAFAAAVADVLESRDRTAYSELVAVVDNAAATAEEETGKTFGKTVRTNAVAAAWATLTVHDEAHVVGIGEDGNGAGDVETAEDDEGTSVSYLTSGIYAIVDEATSTQKDDATVHGLAERIARKFADVEDERHRFTHGELRAIIDDAADTTVEYDDATVGDTARENVTEAIWTVMRTVPDDVPNVSEVAGNRDTASALMDAMRETDILAPPTDCLSPITAELVEQGLRKEYDADFYAAATRDADVHGGDPFIVEAGIAYGGELKAEGSVDLLRFANRVPLVYQRGACATTDVVKRIGWRNYGLDQPGGSGMPNGPAVIMVHVASTNVPFTSESKDALANIPAIEDEVELAIREAARELKSYLNKRRSLQKRRKKQDVIGKILPQMATKVAEVTGRDRPNIDGALARIMNNVSVEREFEDGTVTLRIENHSDRSENPNVTDIVSEEPQNVDGDGDADVVDLDGEWFVQWSPSISAGETAELTYTVGDDAEFDIDVDGVDAEKLTVQG